MGIKRLAVILVLVATLSGAADAPAGGIADEPCLNVAGENTHTCPSGEIGTPYSIRFLEKEGSGCGPGRQTFHFDSGELPPELELAADGTLSGIPTQAGTFQFYVEMREPQDDPLHCAGKRTQKQFTLRICKQLGIVSTPALPPRSEVRVPFRLALSSCGGLGLLTWAHAGGALPAGLQLRANGSIAGAPRVAGTYRFTASATDIRGRVEKYVGVISVAPRLGVRTREVPPARVGRRYAATLRETGGTGAKLWAVARGRLPRGIRLDRRLGILAGTAKAAGSHRVTVAVRDGLRVRATRSFTFVVVAPSAPRSSRRR